MKTYRSSLSSGAALLVVGCAGVFAQTAAPAPAAAAGPAPEVPVELTPFTVTADQDVGYQAANTLAGSRMSTSLKDTAASISIMTEEFLKDIGALSLDEAVNFGNNVELDYTNANNDNGTNEFFTTYRIRGQAATIGRNYFRWKLPADTFNVERIEEDRGPNSILFGIASSGGMVSSQTKQAQTNRDVRRSQLVYGSYDLRRATVDLNQTTRNGKLGVRFNGVVSDTHAYQHFAKNEERRGHLAAKYNLTANSVVRVEYEKGRTFKVTPMSQEVGDNVLKWVNAGRPLVGVPVANAANGIALQANSGNQSVTYVENDGAFRDWRGMAITQAAAVASAVIVNSPLVDNVNFTINIAGPGQTQATAFDTYSAFYQTKLGKRSFLELAYNHQNYDFEAWQAFRISGLQGDPNRFLRDGVTPNPHAGQLYFDTEWEQRLRSEKFDNFRLTASTEFNLGKWGEYRLAGLAERELSFSEKRNYGDIWGSATGFGGAFNASAVSTANTVKHRHYIIERDFGTYYGSIASPKTTGYFSGVPNPLVAGQRISARPAQQSTSDFSDPSEQDSYLAAAQAYFFKRRLALSGGYRADTLYLHEGFRGALDPATGDNTVDNVNYRRTNKTINGHTETYGGVFHVLRWFSVRYNQSNSFELTNSGVRLTPRADAQGYFIGSRVGDNPKGVGQDYGFDLDLLDGRIFIRATKFVTTRAGAQQFTGANIPLTLSNQVMDALQAQGVITAAERALHKIDPGGTETDTESTGYEYSLTANVTKNWRLSANYSITGSVTANYGPEIDDWAKVEIPYMKRFNQNIVTASGLTIGQQIANWEASNVIAKSVEGKGTIGNRREKVSVVSRYSFPDGFLKGFSIGGTARHQSKNVIGIKTNGEWVHGNSFTRADAFCGYRFGRTPSLKQLRNLSLQLNIYNVLDQHDPLIMNIANINAPVLEVNRLRPQEPRYWRLSAEFAF